MKRILLIRHGQTDWNVEGRWQGHVDVPLNASGREQAQALARYLRQRPITAVYSSDLLRAHQTAAAIAEALGLTVQDDPRLREINLGIFQGLTLTEINAKYPVEYAEMRESYFDYVFPEGESRRQHQNRIFEAYQEIVAREPGPEIALVSHGGAIRVLLLKLFDNDHDMERVSVHNTSISVIESDGDALRLVETAAIPHLIE